MDLSNIAAGFSHDGPGMYNILSQGLLTNFTNGLSHMNPEEKNSAIMEYLGTFGIGKKSYARESSRTWANSIKQVLWGKSRDPGRNFLTPKTDKFYGLKKFAYEHDLGKRGLYGVAAMGLLQFASPNQMSGGLADLGIDLGHRPGTGGEQDIFGRNPSPASPNLNPSPEENPFNTRWAHLVKDNPNLEDKWIEYSNKNYKKLYEPMLNINTYPTTNRSTRRYNDSRKKFSTRYKTNDMRRSELVGNSRW